MPQGSGAWPKRQLENSPTATIEAAPNARSQARAATQRWPPRDVLTDHVRESVDGLLQGAVEYHQMSRNIPFRPEFHRIVRVSHHGWSLAKRILIFSRQGAREFGFRVEFGVYGLAFWF